MISTKVGSVIIAYTSPFRLLFRDARDRWTPSLEEINKNKYNPTKLHRISASLDIGLLRPLSMYVTFDGALLLPKLKQFWPIEKAVNTFNRVLGEIVLGGIYFDSVQPTDIDQGILYGTGYYRPFGQAKGFPGQLRYGLQAQIASPLHTILLYKPEHLLANDLNGAHKNGGVISSKFDLMSVEFLLQGISSFAAHDWAGSLSHLWIAAEQVVSCIWKEQIISGGVQPSFPIENRKEFLQDYRTWITSARLEVLFQRGVLSEAAYRHLNSARKSRNELAHKGIKPTRQSADAVLEGLFDVIASRQTSQDVTVLSKVLNQIKARNPAEKHYAMPNLVEKEEEGIWLGPLPPLPGEKEWGDGEYERGFE